MADCACEGGREGPAQGYPEMEVLTGRYIKDDKVEHKATIESSCRCEVCGTGWILVTQQWPDRQTFEWTRKKPDR